MSLNKQISQSMLDLYIMHIWVAFFYLYICNIIFTQSNKNTRLNFHYTKLFLFISEYRWVGVWLSRFTLNVDASRKDVNNSLLLPSSACPTFAHPTRSWVHHLFACRGLLLKYSDDRNLHLMAARLSSGSTCWRSWPLWRFDVTPAHKDYFAIIWSEPITYRGNQLLKRSFFIDIKCDTDYLGFPGSESHTTYVLGTTDKEYFVIFLCSFTYFHTRHEWLGEDFSIDLTVGSSTFD